MAWESIPAIASRKSSGFEARQTWNQVQLLHFPLWPSVSLTILVHKMVVLIVLTSQALGRKKWANARKEFCIESDVL